MVCEPVYMYKTIDILQVNDQKLESNTQKVFWNTKQNIDYYLEFKECDDSRALVLCNIK